MTKIAILALFVGLLFLIAGCSGVQASSTAEERTPAPPATLTLPATLPPEPTAVPSLQPAETAVGDLMSTCNLLDSRDAASLFSSAEVEGPVHKVDQVNHLIFSTEAISATESSCVYYVFHLPGKKDQQFLQITYWVDVPDQATSRAWDQVGADAQSKAAQVVPGVGGGAFYNNGLLTFKNGGAYVTIGIIDTNLNLNASAGVQQEITMEKQIALDAQSHLASQ